MALHSPANTDLSGHVPYTGASSTLNLGANNFIVDTNTFFVDATTNRVGFGTASPTSKIQIDSGTATASAIKFTAGTTTGVTAADGFDIGIATNGDAEIRQREINALRFYTSNVNYMSLASNGPTLTLDSQGSNSANAGTIVFRTASGSESSTLTFDASANLFKLLYGATQVWQANGSAQMGFANGSQGTPSISFTSDLNTGFFRESSDVICVTTGNQIVARFGTEGLGVMGAYPAASSGGGIVTYNGIKSINSTYGIEIQNATDYVSTTFSCPDYSGGGGIYGGGAVYIKSNVANSYGNSDIYIESGHDGTGTTGHINITGCDNSGSGGGGWVYIKGGQSISGYTTGSVLISGGSDTAYATAQGGNVYIEAGTGFQSGVIFLAESNTGAYFSIFGVSPTQRVTSSIGGASFSSNGGTAVTDTDTFNGYTIGQIVTALQAYGWLT